MILPISTKILASEARGLQTMPEPPRAVAIKNKHPLISTSKTRTSLRCRKNSALLYPYNTRGCVYPHLPPRVLSRSSTSSKHRGKKVDKTTCLRALPSPQSTTPVATPRTQSDTSPTARARADASNEIQGTPPRGASVGLATKGSRHSSLPQNVNPGRERRSRLTNSLGLRGCARMLDFLLGMRSRSK